MKFLNKMKTLTLRTLPASANPIIGRSVGTKTVPVRLGGRNSYRDHARSRIVFGALFYGRAYWGTLASAGVAITSGPPIRYRPTTKNPFDRRAFVGGLI